MRLAALLCLLVLASACAEGSDNPPTAPPPAPQSRTAPSPAPVRQISIGEEVEDTLTFHGDQRVYELTAPLDGTLVVRVSWERSQGVLELMLADRWLYSSTAEGIIGRLVVVAGQQYRVLVADGARWDYDHLFLPFALTTRIE